MQSSTDSCDSKTAIMADYYKAWHASCWNTLFLSFLDFILISGHSLVECVQDCNCSNSILFKEMI